MPKSSLVHIRIFLLFVFMMDLRHYWTVEAKSGEGLDVAIFDFSAGQNTTFFLNEMQSAILAGDAILSTRLLRTAIRVNSKSVYEWFAGRGSASTRRSKLLRDGILKLAMAVKNSAYQTSAKPSSAVSGRENLGVAIEILCSSLLLSKQVSSAILWWHLRLRISPPSDPLHIQSPHPPLNPGIQFQNAVPQLMQPDEDIATLEAVKLIYRVREFRRIAVANALSSLRTSTTATAAHHDTHRTSSTPPAAAAASIAAASRESVLTEARVHLLQRRFTAAVGLLTRLDAYDSGLGHEGLCLLMHGREALLDWSNYAAAHARLAVTIRHLLYTDAPYASQCTSPFAALASPLDSDLVLGIAASAARREEARLQLPITPAHVIVGSRVRLGNFVGGLAGAAGAAWLKAGVRAPDGRLRVGYVTSEFGDNSVGKEMAAVAAAHDRRRVVAVCFALTPAPPAAQGPGAVWRARMASHCEGGHLHPLSHLTDRAAAGAIAAAGVHVLLDLNGWMPGGRPGILAHRPAPVQAGYKNFVASMAAAFVPYLVADRVVSPPDLALDYTEGLLLLPRSFYAPEAYAGTHPECAELSPRDRPGRGGFVLEQARRQMAAPPPVDAGWALPPSAEAAGPAGVGAVAAPAGGGGGKADIDGSIGDKYGSARMSSVPSHPAAAGAAGVAGGLGTGLEGPVVANFNNWKKVDPLTVGVWAAVLRSVPGAVLWLLRMLPYPGPEAAVRRALAARGVDPRRVVATDMLPAAEHLAAKRGAAALCVDSLAYGAHSTAVEALWAGLPVLTAPRRRMAARVAAGAALAAGAPHLVARDPADMAAVAIRLLRPPAAAGPAEPGGVSGGGGGLWEVERRLVAARRAAGGLFDVGTWTEGFERGLAALWDVCRARLGAGGDCGGPVLAGGQAGPWHVVAADRPPRPRR